MDKGTFVKDITPGDSVKGIFAVAESALLIARNGDQFWTLRLQDCTGAIDAKIWAPLSQKYQDIPVGSILHMTARCTLYKDRPQLEVASMTILQKDAANVVDVSWLIPTSPHDLDEMLAQLLDLCAREFTHAPWRKMVMEFWEQEELRKAFRIWPAAKSIHHAYAGGLLEHTFQVFRICQHMADLYSELDRQTLLAGALFHDVGKLRELSGGISNDYTTEGNLMGHLVLGAQMVSPYLDQSGLEEPLKQHLLHLVLSHHGLLEYNAATLPKTPEALAMHAADDIDAKLAMCRNMFSKFDEGQSGWIPYKESRFNRPMLRAERTLS